MINNRAWTNLEVKDIVQAADMHSSSRLKTDQTEAFPSSLIETPDEIAGHPISPSEVSFFKKDGYLIKRGLLEKTSLQPALDYIWERAPSCVSRHSPSTYAHAHRLWERTAINGAYGGDQSHWSGTRGDATASGSCTAPDRRGWVRSSSCYGSCPTPRRCRPW